LQRKEKGFAYFETHAGRGIYELRHAAHAASQAADRILTGTPQAQELLEFAESISRFRAQRQQPHAYPGSPLIAAQQLRSQDRAVLCEIVPAEARILEHELETQPRMRVEQGDGFERVRAWLPPSERRGLILIDPPYEEHGQDFSRVIATVADALRRFSSAVIAIWYPIKDARDTLLWQDSFAHSVRSEALLGEMWLYPRDSRVALNGSGMLIVNPPYLLAERMRIWLPELQSQLDVGQAGGMQVTTLSQSG
jgi:23S rRNA (adenine2030-N6)-methyltransferase